MALKPTPADVMKGIVTAWAADATLNTLIPSDRLYFETTPEGTLLPCANCVVDMQSKINTSGAGVVLFYRVDVRFYFSPAENNADQLLEAVGVLSRNTSDQTAGLVVQGGTVATSDVETQSYGILEGAHQGVQDVIEGSFSVLLTITGSVN